MPLSLAQFKFASYILSYENNLNISLRSHYFVYPIEVGGYVRIYRGMAGHAATCEAITHHTVGDPTRVFTIEIHERRTAVAGTSILGELTASAHLFRTQFDAEFRQNLRAIVTFHIWDAQLQLNRAVYVAKVLIN